MASLENVEQELKSFIGRHDRATAETKSRLLAVEQRITAPRSFGDDTGSETKAIAPKDPQTGTPILSKNHRLSDNLPGEKRGLDPGKYLRGLITGSWEGAPEE